MPKKNTTDNVDIQVENLLEVELENNLITESFASKFYAELADVEGIDEYLRLTILTDLKKYFMATDEKTRDQVRGHMAFANALKKRILDTRK